MDNKRITLSDGTTWEPRAWANSLLPCITNVDDPERDMTNAQWEEYADTFCKRNAADIKAARAKLHRLSKEAFARDVAARRSGKP